MSKVEKKYLVTKTFVTLGDDKKEIGFLKSDKPQALGEYGELAVQAGCATEYLTEEEPELEPEPEPEPEPKG